jgi:hypothetical protein
LLLECRQKLVQQASIRIDSDQVIKVRFKPAEFHNRLKLVQNSELIDLLTDLRTGGRKRNVDDSDGEYEYHSEFSCLT